MRTGDPGSDPMPCVVGEPVVDVLSAPPADTGTTAPQFVARPGGNALDVAVAAGPLGTRIGAGAPTRAELDAARSAR